MSTDPLMMDDVAPTEVAFWSALFSPLAKEVMPAEYLLKRLNVRSDDILTARLTHTMEHYMGPRSKKAMVIPGGMADLQQLMDIFCILATFDNLARSRYGDLRKPAFWVRIGSDRRNVSPAIPMEIAASLCRVKTSFLRQSLILMVKDGAVEFIRTPDDVAAIRIMPGFINTRPYMDLLRT